MLVGEAIGVVELDDGFQVVEYLGHITSLDTPLSRERDLVPVSQRFQVIYVHKFAVDNFLNHHSSLVPRFLSLLEHLLTQVASDCQLHILDGR